MGEESQRVGDVSMVLTDANGHGGESEASDDVFDEIGLAGADEGGGLAVVVVVIGGATVPGIWLDDLLVEG